MNQWWLSKQGWSQWECWSVSLYEKKPIFKKYEWNNKKKKSVGSLDIFLCFLNLSFLTIFQWSSCSDQLVWNLVTVSITNVFTQFRWHSISVSSLFTHAPLIGNQRFVSCDRKCDAISFYVSQRPIVFGFLHIMNVRTYSLNLDDILMVFLLCDSRSSDLGHPMFRVLSIRSGAYIIPGSRFYWLKKHY